MRPRSSRRSTSGGAAPARSPSYGEARRRIPWPGRSCRALPYTPPATAPQLGFAAKLTGVRIVVKESSPRALMGGDVTNVTRAGELVRQRLDSLSPAERKLARVLLASYPIARPERGGPFAERAGGNPPAAPHVI